MRLPDASSLSKKLVALLLLRLQLKLPGADLSDVAKEAVSLSLQGEDEGELMAIFSAMSQSDVETLLATFEDATVKKLHGAKLPPDALCRSLVNKELACRLAKSMDEESLQSLWNLMEESLGDERVPWVKGAACLLAAHFGRLGAPLQHLPLEVLAEAGRFLEEKDGAAAFCQDFFKCDVGISALEQWPLRSAALIFQELAVRVPDETPEEKLRLLLKAYSINDADPVVQDSLSQHIKHHIVQQEPSGCEMEGLFLKLALKEEVDLSSEVLSKLTLEARHLNMASPEQLMLLAHQLGNHGRKPNGAGVAVFAATAFASNDKVREAEEAFLKAFALDPSNPDAAKGLAQAVSSAHERCDQLGAECKELKGSNEELKATCQGLQQSCAELKAKAEMPRVELDSPMVWDLSTFDFSTHKESPEFQLPGGVEAHLRIRPNCLGNGIDNLYLFLHQQVHIKGTVQLDGREAKAFELTEAKCVRIKPSERPKSVTLRILSVQAEGSELRFG